MCSEFSSPMRFHVTPASVDLYTPSPKLTLRWLLFSPVPSQTMFEFLGSTVTTPSEYEPCLSKTGVNVLPRFSVFHRLPADAATYQTLGFFGSIATSEMRPDVSPGPIERNATFLKVSAVMRSLWPLMPEMVVAAPRANANNPRHTRVVGVITRSGRIAESYQEAGDRRQETGDRVSVGN